MYTYKLYYANFSLSDYTLHVDKYTNFIYCYTVGWFKDKMIMTILHSHRITNNLNLYPLRLAKKHYQKLLACKELKETKRKYVLRLTFEYS